MDRHHRLFDLLGDAVGVHHLEISPPFTPRPTFSGGGAFLMYVAPPGYQDSIRESLLLERESYGHRDRGALCERTPLIQPPEQPSLPYTSATTKMRSTESWGPILRCRGTAFGASSLPP